MTKDFFKKLNMFIGKESEVVIWEVEKGAIRKFAEAVGDSNPLWLDDVYASNTRYGGLIAPPTFVTSMRNDSLKDEINSLNWPYKRRLNGGNDIELYQPIRVGDSIKVVDKLVDIKEKQGKRGKMITMVFETTYINQFGELVAKVTTNAIRL